MIGARHPASFHAAGVALRATGSALALAAIGKLVGPRRTSAATLAAGRNAPAEARVATSSPARAAV